LRVLKRSLTEQRKMENSNYGKKEKERMEKKQENL
jgi:hypothetical protein